MEAPGVLSYHYPLYLCRFYACCLEFFVLSIIYINAPEGCQHGTHYHCSPKEHPGLGAACARRHWAFLRARGRDGGGERRRLWREELGAGRRGVGGGVELGLGRRGGLHRGHVP